MSTRRIDFKNAVLKIKDGGSNNIEVILGEGNFTWTENVERIYELDRGQLDDVVNGDEQPLEVSMDFKWLQIKAVSGGAATIEDALKKRGGAASWVSADSDACRPYAVDLELTHTPTCEDGPKEVVTFPDFRYESLSHDLKEGTCSCSGKCNATEPTIVTTSQSTSA